VSVGKTKTIFVRTMAGSASNGNFVVSQFALMVSSASLRLMVFILSDSGDRRRYVYENDGDRP
jgi:hypothetical protein